MKLRGTNACFRWLPVLAAVIGTLCIGGCGKKPVEETAPPTPDSAGRMPTANQGTLASPGGGSGQVAPVVTDD